MEDEKLMYQVDYRWNEKSIPVDWSKLPDDLISVIQQNHLYTVMCYGDSGLSQKTVVYFRKVKKFRKGITEFKDGDIVFGV